MASLYGALFSYQPTGSHTPRENFLTQALADLLTRFTPASCRSFVRDGLFSSVAIEHEGALARIIDALASSRKAPRWRTQCTAREHSMPIRYLDLLLECDGRPLVVIENKVDAPFTDGQLEAYGRWITENGGLHHGLVLLTHWTTPPEEFLDKGCTAYGDGLRAVCSWSRIYRWLKHELPEARESEECLFLAAEFVRFLEDQMNINHALTMSDLALVQLASQPLRVIRALLDDFPETDVDKLLRTRANDKDLHPPMIARWKSWAASRAEAEWWVAWGLQFETTTLWDTKFEIEAPSAFVIIGSDKDPLPMAAIEGEKAEGRLEHWRIYGDRMEKRIAISSLLSIDPEFQSQYRHWTNAALREAVSVLAACGAR